MVFTAPTRNWNATYLVDSGVLVSGFHRTYKELKSVKYNGGQLDNTKFSPHLQGIEIKIIKITSNQLLKFSPHLQGIEISSPLWALNCLHSFSPHLQGIEIKKRMKSKIIPLCFHRTYKELKFDFVTFVTNCPTRFHRTYKELKFIF